MNEQENDNKASLKIELVKQYGQLSTAYVASSRDYCLETKERLKFLQKLIEEIE